MGEIVELQMKLVIQRLKDQRRIAVTIDEAAKKLLAKKGYNPSYGARPLKRVIQHEILDELALKIIKGEIVEGQSVTISAKKDQIFIT